MQLLKSSRHAAPTHRNVRTIHADRPSFTSFQGLPFDKIEHRVDTLDAQPSNEQGGVLVLVTGALLVRNNHLRCRYSQLTVLSQIDEEQKPMNYTQTFQLMPEGGSFFVFNDIFKLVYPAS